MPPPPVPTEPQHPFEVFFTLRYDPRPLAPPRVLTSLPWSPQQLLLRVPLLGQFCFPEKAKTVSNGEVDFTFVLTNEMGVQLYGHCVRSVNAEVYGIISRFPWCRLFQQVMRSYRYNGDDSTVIEALSRCAVPPPGHGFLLAPRDADSRSGTDSLRSSFASNPLNTCTPTVNVRTVSLFRPPDGYNPYVDASPGLLLRWMSTDTLLKTVSALLCERRVAIVGPDVGTVSHVILGLLSLMRPFAWHHVLVPVAPYSLLTILAAPTPFIVGVLQSQLQDALKLGGVNHLVVVVLDGCTGIYEPDGPLLNQHHKSKIELVHGDEEEEYVPPPTLPWTSNPLCSLRLAISRARRIVRKLGNDLSSRAILDSQGTEEADRILLNAFMDYYVHAFGRSLHPSFDAKGFVEECVKRGDAKNAEPFFKAVVDSILFMQFRDRYLPSLKTLENEASRDKITTCEGWLPESCGFAEAALLILRDMYPCASPLAEKALRDREGDSTRVATTLVSLQAPLLSFRSIGRLCSYGIDSVIAAHSDAKSNREQQKRRISATGGATPPRQPRAGSSSRGSSQERR